MEFLTQLMMHGEWLFSLAIGGMLMLGVFGGTIISWLIQEWVGWINETGMVNPNWFVQKVSLTKFKHLKTCSDRWNNDQYHTSKDGVYGEGEVGVDFISRKDDEFPPVVGGIMELMFLMFILPLGLLICFKLYPLTLAIGGFIVLSHLARFTKRISTKLKGHIADKKAHKEGE